MVRLVLSAIDASELGARVLRHAVGLAAAMQSRLLLLHVGDMPASRLDALLEEATPYGAGYVDAAVRVEPGAVVETILRVAHESNAGLIVAGTRARRGIARLLLGSTSAELLQATDLPVLLVPPSEVDVLTLSNDRVTLHFGAVLAAVDLAESNGRQLAWASHFASLAKQRLELLTVATDEAVSDHDAAAALKARGHGLTPVAPTAFIVRRGEVAEEIARCALAESSGLVVMGLRQKGRGSPGTIASRVMETHDALVLAVPDAD
jgi:nucleotide-binding universal stress UspA family protein